jgi:hypothetical protein
MRMPTMMARIGKTRSRKIPKRSYEEVDYAQVLQHINNFLPVKEMAERPVDLEVLRQFSELVDNERCRPLPGLGVCEGSDQPWGLMSLGHSPNPASYLPKFRVLTKRR